MTRFEEVRAEYMAEALTVERAEGLFRKSCDICCVTGKRIECDRCGIAVAFEQVKFSLLKRA